VRRATLVCGAALPVNGTAKNSKAAPPTQEGGLEESRYAKPQEQNLQGKSHVDCGPIGEQLKDRDVVTAGRFLWAA